MHADSNQLASIRAAFPKEGLFAEKDFLLSPDPFPVDAAFAKELEQLGHRLFVFQRACNELYQRSVKGKQPAWIAEYLDAGKPADLIELSRQKQFRDDVPLVIRPDLILTETGYTIAEIDSVPGGIGLTGWLNQTYAALGRDVIGGAEGMLDGFRSLLPDGGDIVISEEASTYRPEMNWVAAQLNERSAAVAAVADRGQRGRFEFGRGQRPQLQRAVARRGRRNLRTNRGPERLPLFRVVRSSQSPARLRADERGERGRGPGHAALQTVSRGENVVRAFLDAPAPRILAARVGGEIFFEIAGGNSLQLAARSDAVAAARRHSSARDLRLARSRKAQPEGARPPDQSERLFAVRVGESRDRRWFRCSAERMGTRAERGARGLPDLASDHATLSQSAPRSTTAIGTTLPARSRRCAAASGSVPTSSSRAKRSPCEAPSPPSCPPTKNSSTVCATPSWLRVGRY